MIIVRVSECIQRSVADVFQFAGSFEHDSLWRAGIVAIQQSAPGAPFAGMQIQEALSFMGNSFITKAVVESVEPNGCLSLRAIDSGMVLTGRRSFEMVEGGTRFTYELRLQPTGIYQLLPALTEELFTCHLKDSLTQLKNRLEGRAVRRIYPPVWETVGL